MGNFTYGATAHIQAVFDTGVVPKLLQYLHETAVLWESNITRTVLNITVRGTPAQAMSIVDCGVVPPLCSILAGKQEERASEALRAISNLLTISGKLGRQVSIKLLLTECGGVETLRGLQNQNQHGVASEIMRRFFAE